MQFKDYVTLAVSLLAIVITLYGVFERSASAKRDARLRVSDICDELAQLSVEQHGSATNATIPGFNAVRNGRREVLTSTAHELVTTFALRLSTGELKVLGDGMRRAGSWDRALDYYRSACNAAPIQSVEYALALRARASLLLLIGSPAEAEQLFQMSVAAVPKDRDDHRGTRCETYTRWGEALREAGLPGASAKFEQALQEVRTIESIPNRTLFTELTRKRAQIPASATLVPDDDPSVP